MYDVYHIGGASPSILCGNDSAGLIGLLALSHMASNSRLFRPFLAASLYVLLESLEFDLFCSLSLGWEVCSVFLLVQVWYRSSGVRGTRISYQWPVWYRW